MAKLIITQPVPASAFSLGRLEPYGAGYFLPIIIDDKYSEKHQYIIKFAGLDSRPGCQDLTIYGLPTTQSKGGKCVLKVSVNFDIACFKTGESYSCSAASQDANGNYTAFGESFTFQIPQP